MELNNIVGFKAVDKDGNEQNVTVDEMVDMVATRMVSALSETSSLSEISTLATAAATGNDVYENELPTVTDAANVRVLQSSGDAAQMTMQSLATKLGGLIPLATKGSNGLMDINGYRGSNSFLVESGVRSNDFIKLFSLSKYRYCIFNIIVGDTSQTHKYIASVYVNNRSNNGYISVRSKLLYGTLNGLYAKMDNNDELIFYIKIPEVNYPTLAFSFDVLSYSFGMSVYGNIDNSVIESDLNIVM